MYTFIIKHETEDSHECVRVFCEVSTRNVTLCNIMLSYFCPLYPWVLSGLAEKCSIHKVRKHCMVNVTTDYCLHSIYIRVSMLEFIIFFY